MRIKIFLFISNILLISGYVGPLIASQADSVIVKKDIPYSDRDSAKTRLDLYLPARSGVLQPGVFLVHGGGWRGGDRTQWGELARVLAKNGFVCASAGYRLLPEHRFPAAISDVRLAMDYFKSHAAEYGLDPKRVGAVGSSAGGHLVALLATVGPGDRLGDEEGKLSWDTRPQAVACYNPVLDFVNEPRIWPHQLLIFNETPEKALSLYLEESPALRVKGGEPPFLFLYGTRDDLTPEEKSRAMVTSLAAAGVPVEVAFFHGMEHGFGYSLVLPEQVRAAEVVADFFKRRLR
jgi:acetyl esterase/lipase